MENSVASYVIYFQPHIQRLVVLTRFVFGKYLVRSTTGNSTLT